MLQSALGLLDSQTGWTGWEAAAHGPADAVTIPDAQLLFGGEYKRAGTDLILSNPDHQFVVHDYFRNGNKPTLLSPDGGRVTADIVEALTGHGDYAQAGAPAQTAPTVVGRVVKFDGNATVIRNGVAVSLHVGDGVLKGDVLQTGAGTMAVTFNDSSTLTLTENSRLAVNDFVYQANGSANSEILDLVRGSLSFVSGEVAHSGGHMNITTPIATMGIRGTVGTVSNGDDGTVHFSIVESATGAVLLDSKGNVFATITANGPDITVHFQNAQLVAQETQKSPQEITQQQALLQNILSTQAVGQQILQQFFNQQPNPNPQSTDTQHTQINIDITKTASDNGPSTGPINTGNNPPPQDNTPVVHVVVTDTSNNHVILDEHIQQPLPLPTPTPINHAPVVDLAPIITEVPIPSHQLNDGTDAAATQEIAPAMSHDGRWVVFFSDEINPDSNSNNNNNPDKGDVLLYDRLTGVTTVLTDATHIPLNVRQAGETFSGPSISGDGSTVVFRGEYPTGNTAGNGPSSIANIYVYDRASNTTHVLTNPNDGNTPYSVNDQASIGGGNIVFASDDFGNNNSPPIRHLYVTDLSGHIRTDIQPGTVGITEPSNPNQSQVEFQQPSISGNGQYLTFWTVAHTFDPNTNTNTQVGPTTLYTYDRSNGHYQIIATTSGNDGDNWLASMSGDGRYVVFQSDSDALDVQVGGVANGHMDIFVFDRQANDGTGGIIGITDNAAFQANGASERASISDAGNDIIFASLASNLVAGDTNGQGDTFVYDVPSNTFTRVSVASDGAQANGDSTLGADISGGHFFQGALVTFGSTAGNLVTPNDTDNGQSDIFVVDRTGGIIGSVTEDDTTPAFSGAKAGTLSTHGAFNFSDVDLTDAHTIQVIGDPVITAPPGFVVPQGGLGTFTPTLVDSSGTGHGEVAWTFTVRNANALVQGLNGGERVSEVYTVQIDDGHGGVVTQDVTIVIGGTPDAPEIHGPGSETVDIQLPAGQCSYDRTGDVAFSDPDLTDSHHVQVFFDSAESSNGASQYIAPIYNSNDTSIILGTGQTNIGTFSIDQMVDSTGGVNGNVHWDFNQTQTQLAAFNSYVPAGTQFAFDIHVIDGNGQDVVQKVIIHAPGPGTWISSLGGDWGDGTKWFGGIVPPGSGADHVFIDLPLGQTVTFDGSHDGFFGSVDLTSLTIGSGVTFDVTNQGFVTLLGGDLDNSGTIDVVNSGLSCGGDGTNGSLITVEGTTGVISSTFDMDNGTFANSGTVDAKARGWATFGSVTGGGVLKVDGGVIELGGADVTSAQTVDTNEIDFTAPGGMLMLSGQGQISGHISGFAASDTLSFIDEQVTVTGYDSGTGILQVHLHSLDGLGDSNLSLTFDGNAAGSFSAQFDGLDTLVYFNPSPAPVHGGAGAGVWSNAQGGDWGVAGNWQNSAVPDYSDDITLNTPVNHTVTFNGSIDGQAGFAQANSLTVGANVTFRVSNRGELFFTDTLANSGTVDVVNSGLSFSGNGTNGVNGLIVVEGTTGAISSTFDMDNGTLANSGTVDAKARGWATFGSVTGGGTLKVDGGVITLGGAGVTSAQTIDTNAILFAAAGGLLMLDGQGAVAGHISGFDATDNVSFIDEQVTVAGYDSGTGVLQLHLHSLDGLGDHNVSLTFDGLSTGNFTTQFDGLDSLLYFNPIPAPVHGGAGAGVWSNVQGGDWGVASNWQSSAVPDYSDDITLNSPVGHTVTFNGAIDGQQGFASAGALTVASGVTFNATHQASLFFSGDLHNSGSIDALDSGLSIGGVGVNTGTIDVHGTSGFISSTLDIAGTLDNTGTVVAGARGSIGLAAVTGAGLLVIDGGAIGIDGADTNDVRFSTAHSGTLLLGDATGFAGNISGFAPVVNANDLATAPAISLQNFDATSVNYVDSGNHSGVLHLLNGGTDIALHLYGDYSTANFAANYDGLETLITDQGPVISAAHQTATDNGGSTTVSGLSIADLFEAGSQFNFTMTAGHGTLALADSNDALNGELSSNGGNGTLSATASLSDINTALSHGFVYTPNAPEPPTDSVSIKIEDVTGRAIDELNLVFNKAGAGPGVTLTGTNGKDILYATGFNDTLTGGASSDTFVFRKFGSAATPNTDTITDFNVFQDYLNIDQAHFTNTAALLAATTDVNGHAVITVDDASHNTIGTIALTNVTTAQLTAHQDHILLAA